MEYDNILNPYKRNDKLQNELQKKLEKEYQEYLEKVFERTKDEIIESAYEITTKEELKDEIMYFQLSDIETKALLNHEDLLNDLYYDWIHADMQLGDVLANSLIDSILRITKRFNIQQNEEEKEN